MDAGDEQGLPMAPAANKQPEEAGAQNNARAPLAGSGFSSFALKILAIIGMTCNHFCYVFYYHLSLELRCVLIAVGGITFPIMAYLLVEGYLHTSSPKRYALRLLVFALLAQVPFWLFLGHRGNVLFTLLASLGVLYVADRVEDTALRALGVLGLALLTWMCDWGLVGPVVVLLFYRFRDSRWSVVTGIAFSMFAGLLNTFGAFAAALANEGSWRNLPFVLYFALGNPVAIPLLNKYNGTRGGRPLKWLFYLYYPAHIAVLGLVHVAVFDSMPVLLAV